MTTSLTKTPCTSTRLDDCVDLYLIDSQGLLGPARLENAKELGFRGVVNWPGPAMDAAADIIHELGMVYYVMAPSWPGLRDRIPEEWAFKTAQGHSSLARDGRNYQPSFWVQDPALDTMVRGHLEEALAKADGVILTTSQCESRMPCQWPHGTIEQILGYWCHDEYSLAAWKEQINGDRPPASDARHKDLVTLRWCQTALVNRLDWMVGIASEFTDTIWIMVPSWFPLDDPLYWAVGLYRLDEMLHPLVAKIQSQYNGRVLIPALFHSAAPCAEHAAGLIANHGWKIVAGAEVAPGQPWRANLAKNGPRARDMGLSGMIMDDSSVANPDHRAEVEELLCRFM